MDNMEDKIETILNNPEMMQKIMAMAKTLGGSSQESPPGQGSQNPLPDIDLGMLQKFSGLAKQSSIDKQQQNLLQALNPYLSRQRIQKLENAMRAARMARVALSTLGSQNSKIPSGR